MFRFTRKPSSGSHSQYLANITHFVKSGYVELVQDVSVVAAYCDLWGVYTRICSHNTDNVLYELSVSTLNQVCNFSQVLTVAPWWWLPCKPKHVGAVFRILICFNNSTIFSGVCISWKLDWWIAVIIIVHFRYHNLGELYYGYYFWRRTLLHGASYFTIICSAQCDIYQHHLFRQLAKRKVSQA